VLTRSGEISAARIAQRVMLLLVLCAVSACGQQEQRSAQNLCARYDQLVTQADQLRALEPGQAKADAIQARADAALARLDQLQAVSEGQFDTLISTLRSAITDVRQSVAGRSDALAATRNELQDALEGLTESLAPLKARLDVQCPATA
jgi:hypothetical protein